MRKLLVCFITLAFLGGCSFGPSDSRQFEYEDTAYQNEQRTDTPKKLNTAPMELGDVNNKESSYKDYGFSRLQKQEVSGRDGEFTLKIDKQEVAKFISYLEVKLPSVDDAATLVTDQEVFIAYSTHDDQNKVRHQVEKTAQSALPSYYHIYTSNRVENFNNIEELQKYGDLTDDQLEEKIKFLSEGFDVYEQSLHFDKMSNDPH